MNEPTQVEGQVSDGVVVLRLKPGEQVLSTPKARSRLIADLPQRYRELRQDDKVKSRSCVVVFPPLVVDSPLGRALFKLWEAIASAGEGGQLVCVNYPQQFLPMLTTLGITSLPGFSLADTEKEALDKLK
jgi:hypothetical protein